MKSILRWACLCGVLTLLAIVTPCQGATICQNDEAVIMTALKVASCDGTSAIALSDEFATVKTIECDRAVVESAAADKTNYIATGHTGDAVGLYSETDIVAISVGHFSDDYASAANVVLDADMIASPELFTCMHTARGALMPGDQLVVQSTYFTTPPSVWSSDAAGIVMICGQQAA